MDNPKLAELNKQLKDLQKQYKTTATDYLIFKDEFIGKLEGLGDEIQAVKWKIRQEKMPREE